MSLVNEMLQNLDARRARTGSGGTAALAGLRVGRRSIEMPGLIARSRPAFTGILIVSLMAVVIWDRILIDDAVETAVASPEVDPLPADAVDLLLREAERLIGVEGVQPLPSVSTPGLPTPAVAPAAKDPVELLTLEVEATEARTRLVFGLTRETGIRLDRPRAGRSVELRLAETQVAPTFSLTDLSGTHVESIHMSRVGDDLGIILDLVTGVRTQSAMLAGRHRGRLIIDLYPVESGPESEPEARSEDPPPAFSAGAETQAVEAEPMVRRRMRAPSIAELADQAYRRALELDSLGEEDAAISALRDALAFNPVDVRARDGLVSILLRLGRDPEAEAVLVRGRRLMPGHSGLARAEARLLMRRGELERAAAILDEAPPPVDADPEFHALAAAIDQRLMNHRGAAQRYRELLRLDSRRAVWWMGLAISLETGGNPARALVAYRTAAGLGGLKEDSRRYVSERIHRLERSGD